MSSSETRAQNDVHFLAEMSASERRAFREQKYDPSDDSNVMSPEECAECEQAQHDEAEFLSLCSSYSEFLELNYGPCPNTPEAESKESIVARLERSEAICSKSKDPNLFARFFASDIQFAEFKPEKYDPRFQQEQAEYDAMSEEATPDAVLHSIRCWHCGTIQQIVKIIPANMRHADPTESYVLQCGHTVI